MFLILNVSTFTRSENNATKLRTGLWVQKFIYVTHFYGSEFEFAGTTSTRLLKLCQKSENIINTNIRTSSVRSSRTWKSWVTHKHCGKDLAYAWRKHAMFLLRLGQVLAQVTYTVVFLIMPLQRYNKFLITTEAVNRIRSTFMFVRIAVQLFPKPQECERMK